MKAMETLLELTEGTLDDALAGAAVPVLLDLWAPWCQPCLIMAPVLDSVVAACGGTLQLAKVDVEKYPSVSTRFGVRGIPTMILLKQGLEVGRLVGPKAAAELKAFLAKHGVETAAATSLDADEVEWGAFYGDESLRGFLLERLQAVAASGALRRARFPLWADGEGSVSAALVRHADPRIFERISGMPYAFACALEFAGLGTLAEVDEVLRSVPAGADLGDVAWKLIRWWLVDPVGGWSNAIEDIAVQELRQRWVDLSDHPSSNATKLAASWAALRQDAGRLVGPRNPQRELARCVAELIEELSPPPAPNDSQGWMGALLMRASYMKYAAIVLGHGWSREDLAYEGVRFAWFDATSALEPGGRFSDERLAAANAEWEASHHDSEYFSKAADRDAHWPEWQAAQHQRIRRELTRLIAASPLVAD